MTTPAPDPDDDMLAAEYVLGLLDADAHAQAERRLAADSGFAQAVAGWRLRLSELDETVAPVAPSPDLWSRIAADAAAASSGVPVALAPHHAEAGGFSTWWNSLKAWRALALAASAAVLVLALSLGLAVREMQRAPALIAVLVDGDRVGAVVHVFADGRAELLPMAEIAVPADRALEVWTLWDQQRGPVSIGLMDAARRLPLTVRGLPSPQPGQLFEITLEPRSGSPTGRPTGPILFKGLTAPTL